MIKHPELSSATDQLYKKASGGDPSAYTFLCVFDEYFTDVSKFIERGPHDEPDFVALLARTNTTYSLAYYIRNGHLLHQPIQQAFTSLNVALAWRSHPDEWRRQLAAAEQLGLAKVVLAVANLQLGFVEEQKLRAEIMELAWASFPQPQPLLANPAGKE